ncbi:glycosyltransferase family 4 protein, partial [bacterium]|nr:glycosyltransferase family 4 protein [bacterium]
NNSVIFTGYRNDVQNLYQIMDIFAFTSIDEPWGNVIHEAMACGLPVVAYDSGGYVEIIKNEKNAFLVKPRDLRGFKAILTKLITNEQLRLAVGKQAAQDVVNHPLLQFSHIVDACCNFVRKNI